MKNVKTKLGLFAVMSFFAINLTSCSTSDDTIPNPGGPEGEIDLKLNLDYKAVRCKIIELAPDLSTVPNPGLTWKVVSKNGVAKDSIIGEEKVLNFISLNQGKYTIQLDVLYSFEGEKTTSSKLKYSPATSGKISKTINIEVAKEAVAYKNHITKVFDFLPAFGQFANKMPVYNEGDTHQDMVNKVEGILAKETPGTISLGGFGGYVVFGFDHTVVNVSGQMDFRVLGNAFANSAEPGIIMVAYDKNKNGQPDEDEWYEIAGSEYNNPATIKNYEITYYKPTQELDEATGNIKEYVRWTDNQGNSGWKSKISFHTQSYYAKWYTGATMTFKGTLLPNNAVDVTGAGNNWQLKAFAWGYADNQPNIDNMSAIDIDWAVDKNGNNIKLPGIDFVKVYTGTNQEAGWLGETSTEVAGAVDLHLAGTIIKSIK